MDDQFQQLQMLQEDGGTPGFVAEVVTLFCDDADRIISELAALLYALFFPDYPILYCCCCRFLTSALCRQTGSIDLPLPCSGICIACREQPIVDFDKVDAYVHQLKGSSAR